MGKLLRIKKAPGINLSRWDTAGDIAEELLATKREMLWLKRNLRAQKKLLDCKEKIIEILEDTIQLQQRLLRCYGYRRKE